MNIHGMVHPRADTDRLYVKRKEGGRGLRSIEGMIDIEKLDLRDYVNSRTDDRLIEIVRSSGEHEKGITTAGRCQEYKRNKKNSRYNSWKQKALHGQYICQLGEDVNIEQTFRWLTNCHLKGETEALLIAAQDQALNTNSHRVRILHSGTESKCRMCKAEEETMAHIISGCKTLANGSYKERHITLQEVHTGHCVKTKVVEETTGVKILWDFGIRTEKEIQAHRPDIVFVDKINRKPKIIDTACPIHYNIGEEEREKMMKYQDFAIDLKHVYQLESVRVLPVIISVNGLVPKALHRSFEHLRLPKKLFSQCQKAALLAMARIVWKTLGMAG
uniref:Reverse transcriptase zinc-binding domain-containing protein n=1 Tax=Latimeria chalumnae TaxID=7897 RepID=H3AKE8_LATCH